MLNEGYFDENFVSMIHEPEKWSKEEYYSAFLDMTERFFDTLIASLEYENAILEKFGEDDGEALIEEIAVSNPALMEMEDVNSQLDDQKAVIMNLMAFAGCDYGFSIGEEDVDDDDFPYTGEGDPE